MAADCLETVCATVHASLEAVRLKLYTPLCASYLHDLSSGDQSNAVHGFSNAGSSKHVYSSDPTPR